MIKKVFLTKIYTDLPSLASELIDVVKLFIREGQFEYCEYSEQSDVVHKFFRQGNTIRNQCFFCGEEYLNIFELPKNCSEIELKRFVKRYAKLSVYFCCVKKFGINMPWGALTGIRPTKLAWEIMQSGQNFKDEFKYTFDVSDKKIALTEQILDLQKDYRQSQNNETDIYVGIPFCASRCSYCSFTGGEISKMQKYVLPYFETLKREIKATLNIVQKGGFLVKNIYFGGGTPTSLPLEYLEKLIALFDDVNRIEFTVEAGRPDTITQETFEIFSRHNVNRVSINPQTFSQRILDLIGRKHSVEDIFLKYGWAKKYDFCINMDFIAGLPTQTEEEFAKDISTVIDLSPDNVTVHTLALKKGTPIKETALGVEADGKVSNMVDFAYEVLINSGYYPYYMYRQKYMADNLENIGYCKKGKPSLYNIDIMEETTNILACGSNSISKKIFSEQNRIERVASQKDLPTYINAIDEIISKKEKLFLNE